MESRWAPPTRVVDMLSLKRSLVLVVAVGGLVAAPSVAGAQSPTTATLVVDKVVEGPAPADAEFTVEVECTTGNDPADLSTLTFTADGGSQNLEVLTDVTADCYVTETDDGGAATVTYAAGTSSGGCNVGTLDGRNLVEIDAGEECGIVITNTFSEPEPPPPPPTEPPPAAVPQGVQPSFTG